MFVFGAMNSVWRPEYICYCLAQGVRVRKEKFGLLFYEPTGPTLTFVRSGPWIQPEFFSEKMGLKMWLQSKFPEMAEEKLAKVEKGLSSAFSDLVEKGLIVALSTGKAGFSPTDNPTEDMTD